ncbi:hypothetical protein CERSUDRAFT_100948 [Gelatoporia subvermispora B]|uniref:Uncharacterized protein n=1 Tax=Ceriporiopsis subvermispora (strain B) TaxID=914234 RepID=M2QY15_CERS8|nr:hypothetical protein CERSUDRAFT_100948 [Gelatoporia subvermispora B]
MANTSTPTMSPLKTAAVRMTRSKAQEKTDSSEPPAADELDSAVPHADGQESLSGADAGKTDDGSGGDTAVTSAGGGGYTHRGTSQHAPTKTHGRACDPIHSQGGGASGNTAYSQQPFGIVPYVADPEANVDRHLCELRDTLSTDIGFVAESNGRSIQVWVIETRIMRVVTREALAEAERAHAAYTLQKNPSLPMPDPADSMELSVIVRVQTDNCFLQADAFWNPNRTHAGRFEDIKLRFAGVAPLRPDLLRADFDAAYNNLEWLMSQVENPSTDRQGLVANENGVRHINFRHVVFEPLTDDNAYTPEELALPAQYRTEAWPVESTVTRTARDAIKDTHRTRALQAYDMHGALIPPANYMKMLRGAVCLVRFNVAAYLFGQVPKHRHTFVADVTYMRVLMPPTAPSVPVSPRKTHSSCTRPVWRTAGIPEEGCSSSVNPMSKNHSKGTRDTRENK